MNRLRLVFLVLVALLVAPIVWLFDAASANLDERDRASFRRLLDHHRRSAEFVFERIVFQEETRTPCDFAPLRIRPALLARPQGPPVQRSPLAARPGDPAVLGYFAILPDRTILSPHVDLDGNVAADMQATWPRVRAAAEAYLARENARAMTARAPPELPGPIVVAEPQESPESEPEAARTPLLPTRFPPRYWPEVDLEAQMTLDPMDALRHSPYWRAEEPEAVAFFTGLAESIAGGTGRTRASLTPLAIDFLVARSMEALPARLDSDPVRTLALDGDTLLCMRRVWIDDRQFRLFAVLDIEALVERAFAATTPQGAEGQVAMLVTYMHAAGVRDIPIGELDAAPFYMTETPLAPPFDCLRLHLEALQSFAGVSRAPLFAAALLLIVIGVLGVLAVDRAIVSLIRSAERRQSFVSSVTHELKTPLTTIRLYAEMLRDGVVDDPTRRREYLDGIVGESERLTRLISNVLDLAKLERRAHRFSLETQDVVPIVAEVVTQLGDLAQRQGFVIQQEASASAHRARCDRDALKQVLINLIDNALKFARDGQPRIVHVRIEERHPWLALEVIDHGPGIPPQARRRLGRPFARGADAQARATPGTGLGLSLVRLLVDGMGGRFSLGDRPGGGLVASVLLPRDGVGGGGRRAEPGTMPA